MGMPDRTELFVRALDEERQRSAERLLKIRLAIGVLLILTFAVLAATGLPEARAAVPVTIGYLVVGVALFFAVRARPSAKALSWYAVPLVEIPTAWLLQERVVAISATPDLGASMLLCGLIVAVIAAQMSMQSRVLVATAVLGAGVEASVCMRLGQWHLWPFAALLLGFATLLAVYVPLRIHALLRRVADEASARVGELEERNREVRALNEELRRQVADRSRELAEALSRLTGPSQSPARLAPGDVVEGRYRVVRVLGTGGMGQVHEVEKLDGGLHFALKVISGVAERETLIRFAREAQIAAELDHPNVVAALDVGVSQSGMLYIVMELVPGPTLAEQGARYGDARWALPILRQVASGLAAMHAHGIVHRDLKPRNVLLDGERVKVADFGIASLTARAPLGGGVEGDATLSLDDRAQLTASGVFMGTPLYMAPELARGAREATTGADVFSFGVVAYELLANRLPFAAPPVLARLHGLSPPPPPPLAELHPEISPSLAALVDRCLAQSPEARPSAAELATTLAR